MTTVGKSDNQFETRIASLDDREAVTALLRASYPPFMKPAYDPDILAAALDTMTTANTDLLTSDTYFVAEGNSGQLVGCGGWSREEPGTSEVVDGAGHIRHFATHPDWTGKGVGRAIYSACETQASRAGITQLVCFASLNAQGFYAALGFELIRSIEVAMQGVKFPGVLMRRRV